MVKNEQFPNENIRKFLFYVTFVLCAYVKNNWNMHENKKKTTDILML